MDLERKLITSIIPHSLDQFYLDIAECKTKLVEHRIDGFSDPNNIQILYSDYNLNFLVTNRPKRNSSLSIKDEEARIAILKNAISNGAKFVDIELETPPELLQDLINYAKLHGVTIIVSYHNYEKTLNREDLEVIVDTMQRTGADMLKCACMANSYSDAHIMMDIQLKWSQKIIAFGMGNYGSYSRIISLLYGAPFMYIPLNKKTAPGQLYFEEISTILNYLDQAEK